MIGWCVANKQARIALDVGEEAVRFDNPLLPETRSELALPLVSRGETVGALTIQSAQESAFSEEDIVAFQTMADQLANAIETARLFEETQIALSETEEQARCLALLNEMSEQLGRATNFDEILDVAAVKANQIFAADRASVAMLIPEGDNLEIFALHGAEGATPTGTLMPAEGSEMGMAIREKRLIIEQDSLRSDLGDIRSFMVAPLFAGPRVIGTLNVASKQAVAYTQRDGDLLLQVASLLSSAIENRRLFEDTKSRLVQLTALQETTRAVASTLELDELLDLITQQAITLLQGDGGMINLVDWEKKEDEVVTGHGSCAHTVGFRSPLEDSLSGWVTLHNQPVISNQLQDDHRVDRYVRLGELQNQSAAIAPLTIKDRVIGTLVVMDKQGREGEFDQADLDLLIAFASQTAIAIQNARLFEDTRSRLAQFTALQETTRAVASTLELDELLDLIAQQATTLLQGDGGMINLVDWEKKEDEVVTGHGSCAHTVGFRSPLEDSLSGWVTLHNQPVISNQLQDDHRVDRYVRLGEVQNQSAAIAPLIIKDQVIGTLVVMDKQAGKGEFDQADLDLLTIFANQAAVAIENARLFERTQAALEEVEATHRRYLEREWTEYLQAARTTGYDTDLPDAASLDDAALSEIRQAMERRDAAVLTGGDTVGQEHSALVVPIALRGAVIGALGIHDDSGRQWTESEKALVEAVVGRMAQIAENLRLLEETQRTATRERMIGEVTDRMRRSGDVDALMRTVVREAATALGASRAFVQLGVASGMSGDEGGE